jgi:hypothetical protein
MKKNGSESLTFDQLSQLIAGQGQVTHWRVNAPIRGPAVTGSKRRSRLRAGDGIARSRRAASAWDILQRVVLGPMLFCLMVNVSGALNADLPPGGNFNLSTWKLTLPDTNATEIQPAQLSTGYSNAVYFFTAGDGAMAFWCPVTGGVTDSSGFPRSELRELIDPADENENWSGHGTNRLSAQCKVMKLPSSKLVIIGQIHGFTGNAYPLVKLQFNDGAIEALVRQGPSSLVDVTYGLGSVALSNLITYQLELTEGMLSMTVNGSNRTVNVFQTDPAWANQKFYFKAGSYCQDNAGLATEGAGVAFYQLDVLHVLPAVTTPAVLLTNYVAGADGRFRFTLLVPGGGNYFIQTSTDLVHWNYLLVTNTISDRINVTNTMAPGNRFFRGGIFAVPTIVSSSVDGSGHFTLTMIGPGAGNYYIQGSSDLVHWDYLLFTFSPTGWVTFTDNSAPVSARPAFFYRGDAF